MVKQWKEKEKKRRRKKGANWFTGTALTKAKNTFIYTPIMALNIQCGPNVPGLKFYCFPTNAIYRATIELRSWNRLLQECKLVLV